jgi:hypothetical protein
VLLNDMHFGIIKVGFTRGTVFTANRAKGELLCEDNGNTYPTTKDLDIAIRLGHAQPFDAESERLVKEESEKRRQREQDVRNKQQQTDNDVRSRIINSDEDIVPSIRLPSRKPKVAATDVRTLESPTNIVSAIKPRHRAKPQIIVSDGEQQSIRVDSSRSREHVIMAKKEGWDAKDMGVRQSQIAKVVGDRSIERDESGRLVIRGMSVIRDDSRVGSGESLNAGTVQSFSKEELEERTMAARASASARKKEVVQKRKSAGVDVAEPVVTDDERVIRQVSDEQLPKPKEERRSGLPKLLKRRY